MPTDGHRRRKRSGRLSPRAIVVAQKRAQAMEYPLQGSTFFDIGKALGVTPGRAHQLVDEALSESVATPAEELRTLELGRLEYLLTAFFPRALRGDDRAVNSVFENHGSANQTFGRR